MAAFSTEDQSLCFIIDRVIILTESEREFRVGFSDTVRLTSSTGLDITGFKGQVWSPQ